MDDAILRRKLLCDEHEAKRGDSGELIVKNRRLMERLYAQERLADARLAELVSELVAPAERPRYLTAMEQIELQVVTSKLF